MERKPRGDVVRRYPAEAQNDKYSGIKHSFSIKKGLKEPLLSSIRDR